MSRTEQAFQVAERAVDRGVWSGMVAVNFVTQAEEMTDEQFAFWVNAAEETE